MSQNELAKVLGVSQSFISSVSRGASLPSLALVLGVERVLGAPMRWLLTGEAAASSPPLIVREPDPPGYQVRGVVIDGRRVGDDAARVHRDLQVVLETRGALADSAVKMLTGTAELLNAARDAPAPAGRSASGGGMGPAGTGRRSA